LYTALKAGGHLHPRLTSAGYDAQFCDLARNMRRLARDVPSFRVFFPDRNLCTPACVIEDAE